MAATANELLQGILGVVTQINQTIQKDDQQQASAPEASGGSISSIIGSFGKVKEKDRKVFKGFLTDMVEISKDAGNGGKNLKDLSSGIISLSIALPDLAVGLNELGQLKTKRVSAAIFVLERLYSFMEDMGDASSHRKIKKAISTFDEMGEGLIKIAKPLRMMSNFLLHIGVSIIAFAGSMVLASYLLGGNTPMDALLFIGATVAAFVGMAALLALGAKFIKPGLEVIEGMGKGMLWLAGGILGFAITMNLIGTIMQVGSGEEGMYNSLKIIGIIIVGMVGVFALMGAAKSLISKGVAVAGLMALGMTFLSLGVLGVALAARALAGIAGFGEEGESVNFLGMEVPPMVAGLGTMGMVVLGAAGLFAIMGIPAVAAVIALGSVVALLVSASMIALAYSVREVSQIAAGLNGDEVADNLTTLISATFIGLRDGISIGLLGESAAGKPWWQKAGILAKNTAEIMGGMALISGVAVTLSLFALSLRAFEKVGQIAPIVGHDSDGKPIYGKPVTVQQVSSNIAQSIVVFFRTLSELFAEGSPAMPTQDQINSIVNALMGEGGLRLFGFDVARTKPNLMDALYKFGDVLTFWGKFGEKNEIPMGTDKNGNPIKPVKVTSVAKNIAETLKVFMSGLSEAVIKVDEELAEKTGLMAQILLGEGAFKVFGLSFGRDKPGILEPISKFADIIKQFADGKYVSEYVNGEPVYKKIDYKSTAKKITNAISSFTKVLSSEMEKMAKMEDFGSSGSKASSYLEKFEDMFESLSELAEATTGLDRLGNSLMEIGEGIGLIGENLKNVDTVKLEKAASIAAQYMKDTDDLDNSNARVSSGGGFTKGGSGSSTNVADNVDWDRVAGIIGSQVGDQISAALKTGMIKFEFSPSSNNSGVIQLG